MEQKAITDAIIDEITKENMEVPKIEEFEEFEKDSAKFIGQLYEYKIVLNGHRHLVYVDLKTSDCYKLDRNNKMVLIKKISVRFSSYMCDIDIDENVWRKGWDTATLSGHILPLKSTALDRVQIPKVKKKF